MKTKDIIIKNFIRLTVMLCVVMTLLGTAEVTTNAAALKLSKKTLTLKKGKKKTLTVKNNKLKAKVKWSVSNKFTVKVSKKGKVTALKYGTSNVYAKVKGKTLTCRVTVPDTSRDVTLDTTEVTLNEGSTFKLKATAAQKVTFFSANTAIASVDSSGKIIAKNPGVALITAKSKTGYATCTVTILSKDRTITLPSWYNDKQTVAIRRLSKANNIKYGVITWAKNKDITFKLDNVSESNVKKCEWSVDKKEFLSTPKVVSGSKITAAAKTLKEGRAKLTATVTYTSGEVRTYTNYVYVTNPDINAKQLTLLAGSMGSNRQQFISFEGLSDYSVITWTNSNTSAVTTTEYNKKMALWGLAPGNGTITASVDGKEYTVNYTVCTPVLGDIMPVVAKGKTTKINITGAVGLTPHFTSRNTSIVTVSLDGTITAKKSGVTYVDVNLSNMVASYRVEVAAKGMKTIIKRANYIVNNWKYNQGKRMKSGYYDCSALVWKGYKAYKKYNKKLGSSKYALPAGELFDYLKKKKKIVYYGYAGMDNLKPGDLIFYGDYANAVRYSTPGRTLNIYHVSMYAGNGEVVEKGGQTLGYNGTYYIVGIGRVVN